jgi:predicted ATPase
VNKERLVIKNFGPIKSVDLELGKMTVLIGDQATGKSTIAKVLAVCRYFSYIVNLEDIHSEKLEANEYFLRGLIDWGLLHCLSEKSEIIYKCELYEFEVVGKNVGNSGETFLATYTKLTPNHESFKKLLDELDNLRNDENMYNDKESLLGYHIKLEIWTPNENFFRLNVKKVMNNPLYVSTERTLQTISFDKNLLIADALQDNLKKINYIVRRTSKEKKIEPLSITYKNDSTGLGYIKKENESVYYPLHYGASGYQATIPIILSVKYYIEYEKKAKTFIIEEPELNLFPKTQKNLVAYFAESMNLNNHSFLIPTHSPYILSSLNNLLYAHKIGNIENNQFGIRVNEIVPKQFWLNPENVSVYYLENGVCKNLLNHDEGFINIDDLDSASEIINKEFDQLLSIDVEINNYNNDN